MSDGIKAGSEISAESKPKRRHVATGTGKGGRRAGAGRPAGSSNALPAGAVAAIKALRHRVPEGTPEELAEVADEAFATVVEVMRGKTRDGFVRLQASRAVREEVCGPIPTKTELTGKDGGPVRTVFRIEES